jgi:peptidoglycan/LPS O-acetylase OafA/YrhL
MIIWPFLNIFLVFKSYHFAFELQWLDKLLTNSTTVFIGRISYGIYLYHIIGYYLTLYVFDPVWRRIPFNDFGIFSKLEFHTWVIKFPIYSVIAIGIADLSYRFIELPFLILKDRFFANAKLK